MEGLMDKPREEALLKIAEQAAAWVIELDERGDEARPAFTAWLEESPLHVEMFLRASATEKIADFLTPEDRGAVAATAVNALPSNVMPLRTAQPASAAAPARRSRRIPLAWMAATLAAAGVGLGWYLTGPGSWQSYATAVGEQRTVALDDGSLVHVNTDSRIAVRYSRHGRDIRLSQGEALFTVEPDPTRPFRVLSGDAVVQAVGTAFNVRRIGEETRVAVIQGVVAVSGSAQPSPASAAGEHIGVGQGLTVMGGKADRPAEISVAQVTAWRQRRLVFEWESLEAIAAEFNRYNRSPQIRVMGDKIKARRYTAVFDADRPGSLLTFLEEDPGLMFEAEGDTWVIRGR